MSGATPTDPTWHPSARRLLPWLIFALLELAAIAVFWSFDALPFMDFAGHAGVIALRFRYPQSEFEQQFFVLTGNIGGYSLFRFIGDALARWIGPLAAMRVISTVPVIALPLSMLYVRQRLYRDGSSFFAFVALILSFGYMTQMGLAPFLLAFPVLLWALTEWLVLLDRADAGRRSLAAESGVAVLATVVLLVHAYAFGVFVFLAVVTAVSAGSIKSRLLRLRVLVPGMLFLALSAWSTQASRLPPGAIIQSVPFNPVFHSLLDKLGLLVTPTMTTRTGIDIVIGLGIWLAAILGAIVSRRSQSCSAAPVETSNHVRALGNASAASFLAFLILPHAVRSFDFVDGRLLPIVILLALMAIDKNAFGPRLRRSVTVAAGVSAGVAVVLELVAMQLFQGEADGYREVFATIPANSRLLYLPLEPDSRVFISHPFVHYDKLVLVERPIVPSQLHFHHGTGIFPTAANPVLRLPRDYVSSDLKRIVWSGYRLGDWNYVLIRRWPDARAPSVPNTLALQAHRGGWWLYRNTSKPCCK
jgi:hypothetical protein